MKKYWKPITIIFAILLVGLLVWFLIDYFSIPRLPPWEKERVKQEYILARSHVDLDKVSDGWEERWYKQSPIIWYDETSNVEQENVWRYIGTYGDCYAFLVTGDVSVNGLIDSHYLPNPFPLFGLSRVVYYPVEASIVLYDTKGRLPTYIDFNDRPVRLYTLSNLKYEWLTDEQLEQLTQDIEKIAKSHD